GLVGGGGDDLPQRGAGGRAGDGDVDMRGEPLLWLDGGEVLHVVAEDAAKVLDEPVEQGGEVQRVPGGALVVVAGQVGGVPSSFTLPQLGQGRGRNIAGREGLP